MIAKIGKMGFWLVAILATTLLWTGAARAQVEIEYWLRSHLADSGGALRTVLHRDVKESELLLNNFDQPLVVLAGYCQ